MMDAAHGTPPMDPDTGLPQEPDLPEEQPDQPDTDQMAADLDPRDHPERVFTGGEGNVPD